MKTFMVAIISFIAGLVPLVLGSLIFVGIIENYKSDSDLKIKILEDYFIPTRELVSSCLKSQNELFLLYPSYSASLRLFYEEVTHLYDNKNLNSNPNYEIVLKSVADSHFATANDLNEVKKEVELCKVKAIESLEILSIATGTYNEFIKSSKTRAISLNSLEEKVNSQRRDNTSEITVDDVKSLMRGIGTIDFNSEKGQNELKEEMEKVLPIIEKNTEIMSHAEKSKYDIESLYYSEIMRATSTHISEKFESRFMGWLI